MAITLSLQNPIFWTYALASSIMLLKLLLQPWMTVVRMMKVGGGFRNPGHTHSNVIYANIVVRPISKERPQHMQYVCIASASHVVVRDVPY